MTLAALIDQSKREKEAWRYTSLAALAKETWSAPAPVATLELPAPLTRHRLVIVDGLFRDDLSARQELPDEFFDRCTEKDNCYALTLWNQTCLAIDPIELLFVNTRQAAANEATTKIKIALGQSSRLTLIERHINLPVIPHSECREAAGARCGTQSRKHSSLSPSPLGPGSSPRALGASLVRDDEGGKTVRLIEMDIDLDAQAKLVHGKIVSGGADALHHAHASVQVGRGAFYDHFVLIKDGGLTRCEKDLMLSGNLAEARLVAVMLLRGKSQGDVVTRVRHAAPHTTSRQTVKAALDGSARGVFAGKAHVEALAQKTDAYQLCRALLLSDKAEMDAKPELEIYADDVKCSHGAAVGDLDETALFYLMSRGIDPAAARAMLVEAFVGEVVDGIQSPDLAGAVRQEVSEWLA